MKKLLQLSVICTLAISSCGDEKANESSEDNAGVSDRSESNDDLKSDMVALYGTCNALRLDLEMSATLLEQWTDTERADDPGKERLRKLVNESIPSAMDELSTYRDKLPETEKQLLDSVASHVALALSDYHTVMDTLLAEITDYGGEGGDGLSFNRLMAQEIVTRGGSFHETNMKITYALEELIMRLERELQAQANDSE